MRKSISKILKNCGADAKIIKNDGRLSKFKVTDKKLTLEGIVRPNKYSMTIKDDSGKVLGSANMALKSADDIENRIMESLGTLNMISNVYEDKNLTEEEEMRLLKMIQFKQNSVLENEIGFITRRPIKEGLIKIHNIFHVGFVFSIVAAYFKKCKRCFVAVA